MKQFYTYMFSPNKYESKNYGGIAYYTSMGETLDPNKALKKERLEGHGVA